MLYRVIDATNTVQIIAFVHGARDLNTALEEGS
jgi:hypothetical protein